MAAAKSYAAAARREGTNVTEYWYNVQTHQVEEDAMSDWTQLIGPYKTRTEAEHALEKVRARNEAWEKDDED
ncbi:SPOR domain-containing protein [Arthrobacter silvisoli]|uniref:SPOR domain-containing protein n=1 Tax=Arthrobacter silvisoli TaxID=2291022 RepID=UPI000E20FE72|nr:SPOR domain-containing protein [Arthrobacter silvisoli]